MSLLIVIGVRPHAVKAACIQCCMRGHDAMQAKYYLTQQQPMFLENTLPQTLAQEILNNSVSYSGYFSYYKIAYHIAEIIELFDIKVVLSIGDTKTSLVAALGAKLTRCTIVHYESGLRSSDVSTMEEKIRRKIDRMASIHLVYNDWCAENLVREGVAASQIKVVGSLYEESLSRHLITPVRRGNYALVALHRKETFRQKSVFLNVLKLASVQLDKIIVIGHPSNEDISHNIIGVSIVKSQAVDSFLSLLAGASIVITDSGGICEQASLLGKPVLVLRSAIERPWLLGERTRLTAFSTLESDLDELLALRDIPPSEPLRADVSAKILQTLRRELDSKSR